RRTTNNDDVACAVDSDAARLLSRAVAERFGPNRLAHRAELHEEDVIPDRGTDHRRQRDVTELQGAAEVADHVDVTTAIHGHASDVLLVGVAEREGLDGARPRGAAADVLAAASRLAHAGGAADVVAAVVDAAALARADFVFGGAGAAGAVVRTHIAFAVIRALAGEAVRTGLTVAAAFVAIRQLVGAAAHGAPRAAG